MGAVPDTATAVVAHGIDDLRLEDRPVRTPAADEAVVRIAYGGICGSDLHYWTHGAAGESVLRSPMILGHEVVGTIVQRAADGSGPDEGAAVAVAPATVGSTPGRYPLDRPNLSPGGTYLGSAAHVPHTDGAFATYAVLPSRMLRALPAGLSLRGAALAEPASVAWHAGTRAGDISDARVLVIGSGPIGALAIAIARLRGAREVIAVDVHRAPLDLAARVGATRTLLASDAESIEATEADVAIESSGSTAGLASAIRGTARGGRVVMLGLIPSGAQPVPISLAITRELDLRGAFRFNDEMDAVLRALADGALDVEPIVTHVFPVVDTLEAFAKARDASASSKVLIDFA